MLKQEEPPRSGQPWQEISAELCAESVAFIAGFGRPKQLYLTERCALRASREKETETIWAQVTKTNGTGAAWEVIWSDLKKPQPDGFLTHVQQIYEKEGDHPWLRGKPQRTLSNFISRYFSRRPGFSERNIPLNATLREDIWRMAAKGILLWIWAVHYKWQQKAQEDWRDFTIQHLRLIISTVYIVDRHARRVYGPEPAAKAVQGLYWAWLCIVYRRVLYEETLTGAQDRAPTCKEPAEIESEPGEGDARNGSEDDMLDQEVNDTIIRGRNYYIVLTETIKLWSYLDSLYQQASSRVVPFKPHEGKTLAQVGKATVRQLAKRIPPSSVIERVREAIKKLLNPKSFLPSEIEAAGALEHPWKRRRRYRQQTRQKERRVRSGVMARSQLDPTWFRPILLHELDDFELTMLDRELSDLLALHKQYDIVRKDIETFLRLKPPGFPRRPRITPNSPGERLTVYRTDLGWFDDPFPTNAPWATWHHYKPDELLQFEANARAKWLRAAQLQGKHTLHPLTYLRAMKPSSDSGAKLRDFSIIFYEQLPNEQALLKRYSFLPDPIRQHRVDLDMQRGRLYRYELVITLHGRYAFDKPHNRTPPRRRQVATADIVASQEAKSPSDANFTLHPEKAHTFQHLNAPYTSYELSSNLPHIVFPIDCGTRLAELLNEILAQQYAAQKMAYERWNSPRRTPGRRSSYRSRLVRWTRTRKKNRRKSVRRGPDHLERRPRFHYAEKPLHKCLPKAAIANAHVVSQPGGRKNARLFLHLQLSHKVPPVIDGLENIIGIHMRRDGSMSYAVITFAGEGVEIGDVPLPTNLRIDPDQPEYGDEYVYQMASILVRLALRHRAFIVIEDLFYLTQEADASRKVNRQNFALPIKRVQQVLTDKAMLAGLPEPHITRGVAWSNACAECGHHLRSGDVQIHQEEHACPNCRPDDFIGVPVLLDAAALVYNLPGTERLQLTPDVVADMFARRIVWWDDLRLVADNPWLAGYTKPIKVIFQTDDERAAYILRAYLREAGPLWRARIDQGALVLQPDAGLALERQTVGRVLSEPDTIACVTLAAARAAHLPTAVLQSDSGRFVKPSIETLQSAATRAFILPSLPIKSDLVYPLTGITWAYIRCNPQSLWRAHDERQIALGLTAVAGGENLPASYIPLTTHVGEEVQKRLEAITANGLPWHQWRHDLPEPQVTTSDEAKASPRYISNLWINGPTISSACFRAWRGQFREAKLSATVIAGLLPPLYRQEAQCGQEKELVMHCRRCRTRLRATHNTALVVARLGREQLIRRYREQMAKAT